MYNKVVIIGNLGNAPEVYNFQNGNSKLSFSVATNENFKDRSGEWQKRTDWHNVEHFSKYAGELAGRLTKGARVLIEGRLRNESYQDKQGQTKYKVYILADTIRTLEKTEREGGVGNLGGYENRASDYPGTPKREPEPEFSLDPDDDDLPF